MTNNSKAFDVNNWKSEVALPLTEKQRLNFGFRCAKFELLLKHSRCQAYNWIYGLGVQGRFIGW